MAPCKMSRSARAYLIVVLALFFFYLFPDFGFTSLYAVGNSHPEVKRFDYKGDLYFQGFYLARDLPTNATDAEACSGYKNGVAVQQQSRCREEEDFYRIRFRVYTAFRASRYADILYNLEVGFLTFGRDEKDASGPGTGGQGSGRANLETQQLILKLKNSGKSASLEIGIFSVGTPSGIVIASSGAGLRGTLDRKEWNSQFQTTLLRSVDNSIKDDDSNGFSDDNFRDINLAIASWKYSGIRRLRSEVYGVYRQDDNFSSDDTTDVGQEISRVSWLGLYLKYGYNRWRFVFHGIGNQGNFERPFEFTAKEKWIAASIPDYARMQTQYEDEITAGKRIRDRRKRKIAAAAGELEITRRISDRIELSIVAAGASGRPGRERDGSSPTLRADQFRTAGSAYQFSEIAIDSSGGYSLNSLGKLTGIQARGVLARFRLPKAIYLEIGYYAIDLTHTPVIEGNKRFRLYDSTMKPSNYYGQETNLRLKWTGSSDLSLGLKVAYFDAGAAYKILNDVLYGDNLLEMSFYMQQKF